ncbi:MAG: hypothetical protein HQL76_15145 [Magnetococcales bacterium]|nr:hypothetical protein [Magnetococcales bacterium]
MDKKLNCWDHFTCGRSRYSKKLEGSYCPASLIGSYNGVNDGVAAGRACWDIEGTLCATSACGNAQDERGTLLFKQARCSRCEFKSMVQQEEGPNFKESKRVPATDPHGTVAEKKERPSWMPLAENHARSWQPSPRGTGTPGRR